MGKNGAAMRAAKAQQFITMTREQLEAHDRLLLQTKKEQIQREIEQRAKMLESEANERIKAQYESLDQKAKDLEEKMLQKVNAEWEHKEELFGGKHREKIMEILALLLATSSKVLIEHFGWNPVRQDGKYRNLMRTVRYADALVNEVITLFDDKDADIREYCEEVYQRYGVKFEMREEE